MSVSLYYTALRSTPLTAGERQAIESVERRDRDQSIEPLTSYEELEPGVVYQGAMKLTGDASSAAVDLEHWCTSLAELRESLVGSTWEVSIDDVQIPWNEATRSYESQPAAASSGGSVPLPRDYGEKLAQLEQASAGMVDGRVVPADEAARLRGVLLAELHDIIGRVVAARSADSIELLSQTPAWARTLLDPQLVQRLGELAVSHDPRARSLLW